MLTVCDHGLDPRCAFSLSLIMDRIVEKLSGRTVPSSGVARNAAGKRSLNPDLHRTMHADIVWQNTCKAETVVMVFADHGAWRDVFTGFSQLTKRHLVAKVCKLEAVGGGDITSEPHDSNMMEMKCLDSGFAQFAVPIYFYGHIELSGARYSILLEEKAPSTVDAALAKVVNDANSVDMILSVLEQVMDMVYDIIAAGFNIFDAGPHNLAFYGHSTPIRMLDFEHITLAPAKRQKQNETFLRSCSAAATFMSGNDKERFWPNPLRRSSAVVQI